MNCPKCDGSKTSSFLKMNHEDMVQFKECDDCGFEWEMCNSS